MNIKIEVPIPLTMVSDQELIGELNRRQRLVKWARQAIKEPSNLGRSMVSPSCDVENWDCRGKDDE